MDRSDIGMDERTNGRNFDELKDKARHQLDEVRAWTEGFMDKVEGFVRDKPAMALVVALGAGFLFGRLVRK
jgi:ElaB/YqjD/DUF883 family membrane-anchored ribosome-binding protein